MNKYKVIVSGGGTGGHIFPAIAIVEALKKQAEIEVLFIGALGKMEMEKVPACGYKIEGLPISGLQRGFNLNSIFRNLSLPFKIIISLIKVWKIINKFKPDFAIGTGGYASAPTLKMAQWMGIPTFIQEQNAQPGITNQFLGNYAKCAFVSFEESKKYFKKIEVLFTGNAIRESFANEKIDKNEAYKFFKFDSSKKTIFITGGSLGANAINEAIAHQLDLLHKNNIQVLWQTGKSNYNKFKHLENESCRVFDFIANIKYAYTCADIIITRAGGVLFELFIVGKPAIVLPSPYVADDHQTPNAEALMKKNAAIMLKDHEAKEKLAPTIIELISNDKKIKEMGDSMKSLAKPNASTEIATKILSLV